MAENMKRYSEFYNLPTEGLMYRYGFETVAHERLFIQSFRPLQIKAHILLLCHSYYDHAGVLKYGYSFFDSKGFHVLTFDLPGHGFIRRTEEPYRSFLYVESIREVTLRRHLSSSSLPIYIVAHSTALLLQSIIY